ncbi:class I fructose-bisphosphate aldolase [Nocardioides sp.]|uniref:class I fructose-bisphosphate aldolase n=1 Tax=Nocardioides sp. TaxID=35761 RepID=UPI003D0E3EA7
MTVTAQTRDLATTARRLTSGGRGILAADESIATMSTRLEGEGVVASETTRRDYRQLLLTAPGLARTVSGVIWCDETFGQQLTDARTFPAAAAELGVLAGIKVDTGTVPLPGTAGALVTEGLDGLGERLGSYAARGAAFAKWRAVFDVSTISPYSARVNAQALARYAALCQLHGIVPVVEPEVLAAGAHDLVDCAVATRMALDALFDELQQADVDLTGIVLKPNFVTPGLGCQDVSARTVATVTHDVLRDCVPATVPGIAFLSGGHPTDDACAFLRALNAIDTAPWAMTFSFGRALVNDALATWAGQPANVTRAQQALIANCERAAAATA